MIYHGFPFITFLIVYLVNDSPNFFLFPEQLSKEGLTKYLMSDENAPILLDRLDIYQARPPWLCCLG
jgi:hypothetical protein